MGQTLSEIKHGFEKWLEEGAARDAVRRREILNVCEQVLPWFVRDRIDSDFDTLYGVTNPDVVHGLWKKIKTDPELKSENAERSPVNYTEVLISQKYKNFLTVRKKLSIYPDGGLMNGWSISRNNHRYLSPDEVDASTDVLLTRNQEIKIAVTIETVNNAQTLLR